MKPATIAIVLTALFLGACGQKGALYLPEKSPEQAPQSQTHTDPANTNY